MTSTTPVNTKLAARRALRFESIDRLAADLDRIGAAAAAGTLSTTGNWTAGQILEHCSILWRCAIDGFPSSAPWIVRFVCITFFKKSALSGEPAKPGIKLPKGASYLLPSDDVSTESGLAQLREQVDRVRLGGKRFTHASPIFGELTHEEWTTLQLGHCAMHLSFIQLGDG